MEKLEDIIQSTVAGWKSWLEGEFDLTKSHFSAISIAAERSTATAGRAAILIIYSDRTPSPNPTAAELVFRTFATHEEAQAAQRSPGSLEELGAGVITALAEGSSFHLQNDGRVQTTELNFGPGDLFLGVKVGLQTGTKAQAAWHLPQTATFPQ